MKIGKWTLLVILACLFVWLIPVAQAQDDGASARLVIRIRTEGPLTPAMLNYVQRAVRTAEKRHAEALIFQLDTPGGEIGLMQDIVKALRESRVPVVAYVAPRGGAAWSAGTLIVLAAHAAAMAPDTGIGAASPVGMEGDLGETEERKAKEAISSLARELAAPRGERAVEWAEAAVQEAAAASASEALEMGVVDFIAVDVDDLLAQLDGFAVVLNGEQVVLHTANARVDFLSMSLIEQILHIVVNPTIIFILVNLGIQAILIEISSPGGWVAGTIGVVSIALAVYGLGVLPVNALGLVLIALAIGLFVLEVKATTHGALTFAGVTSMVAGGLILFNSAGTPQYAHISLSVVITVALCFAAMFLFIMTKALQAQRVRPKTGMEGLLGATAVARTNLNPEGIVFVEGERWRAVAEDGPVAAGETVEIVAIEGFCLRVKRQV